MTDPAQRFADPQIQAAKIRGQLAARPAAVAAEVAKRRWPAMLTGCRPPASGERSQRRAGPGLASVDWDQAGVYIIWAASVLASMSTLYDLAVNYGGGIPGIGILFPLTLDVYWLTALRAAKNSKLKVPARIVAAAHAVVAFGMSTSGNILYHELDAGQWHLGHWKAMLVALISSVPLIAAVAVTHLALLARPATAPAARKVRPPQRTAPRPPQRTAPNRPSEPPQGHPGPESTAPVTVPPSHPGEPSQGDGAPTALKPGGRPDPRVLEAAREEWHAACHRGQIHSRRTLAAAVNDRFGYTVIGETSCERVIDAERATRRTG